MQILHFYFVRQIKLLCTKYQALEHQPLTSPVILIQIIDGPSSDALFLIIWSFFFVLYIPYYEVHLCRSHIYPILQDHLIPPVCLVMIFTVKQISAMEQKSGKLISEFYVLKLLKEDFHFLTRANFSIWTRYFNSS